MFFLLFEQRILLALATPLSSYPRPPHLARYSLLVKGLKIKKREGRDLRAGRGIFALVRPLESREGSNVRNSGLHRMLRRQQKKLRLLTISRACVRTIADFRRFRSDSIRWNLAVLRASRRSFRNYTTWSVSPHLSGATVARCDFIGIFKSGYLIRFRATGITRK